MGGGGVRQVWRRKSEAGEVWRLRKGRDELGSLG